MTREQISILVCAFEYGKVYFYYGSEDNLIGLEDGGLITYNKFFKVFADTRDWSLPTFLITLTQEGKDLAEKEAALKAIAK
jgi:hypothetical protein